MKFETTISVIINGVALFDCDVTVSVCYEVNRYNELSWSVDEYRIEGERTIWGRHGANLGRNKVDFAVPESLAKVFDEHLDREHIEGMLVERLIEEKELRDDEPPSAYRDDYHARVL